MAEARSIGAVVGGAVGTVLGCPTCGAVAGGAVGGFVDNRNQPEIGSSGVCPNQPPQSQVSAVFAQMTPAEFAEIQRMWNAGLQDMGEPFPTSAQRFAWHIAGGNDCKVTTVTGKAIVAYYNQLAAKYTPAVGEQSGSNSTGAVAQQQQMDSTGLGGQIRQIGSNILNTAKEIATSTLSGAVAGAQTATQGAQTGASAGTFLAQNAIPLLLFGGLGVLAFFALRK